MSKTCNALRLLGSFLVLLAALIAPAQAQQFNGTLRGVVQDSSGGVVPGAAVPIVLVARTRRSLTSDTHGPCVAEPETRHLSDRRLVAASRPPRIGKVKLDVQDIRSVNVELEVGATAETVTSPSRPPPSKRPAPR